ncbi:MAG: NUDIX hydrolase [Myxococcota bacterium]
MTSPVPPWLTMVEAWEVDPPTTLADTRVFTLRERAARSRTNPEKSGRFVYLDSSDWVNVLALTSAEEVVLIEQYRHGIEQVTLEIPGGMVDPGEEPLTAGVRELEEETGFRGHRARVVGRVSPNPAIQNNWCHTVLVEDVAVHGPQALEGSEEIGVRLVPLAAIDDLVRQGIIHHSLVVVAFHHLRLLRGGPD